MFDIVVWLNTECPGTAWGNEEKVKVWVAERAASEPPGEETKMNELTITQREAARIENAGDKAFGLRQKYVVTRIGGTPHKHDDCDYFVLDWNHDRYARIAALAYADACEVEFPALAVDLRQRASEPPGEEGK